MFKNYITLALRSLSRGWGFSLINIAGLALGLACALYIFIWVYDEWQTDRFHENLDQIYRVVQDQYYNGEAYHVTVTPYPSGDGWKENIPEIEERVRFSYTGNLLLEYEDRSFFERGVIATDSSVFQVFTFPLKYGDPIQALTHPQSLVLSEEMAEKYFGSENPMGKIIEINHQYPFTVTGVAEEIPNNSSLQFDFLVPFEFLHTIGSYNESWFGNSIQTFVMLNPNSDQGPVDEKLTEEVKRHLPPERPADTYLTKFMLEPVKRIHLHTYFGFGHPPGRIMQVRIFTIIGLFVILIAAINYMNLATARSARRSREIGLRKVNGARRKQLISQFLGESFINVLLAVLLAALIVILLFDQFRLVSGKQIPLSFVFSGPFLLGLLGIVILTSLLAGSYPSIFLSSMKPVQVIKGDPGEIKGKGWLRKVLVILQYGISLFLIIGTTLVFAQTRYMANREVGFDKEGIHYIRLFGDMRQNYNTLRQAMENNPNVLMVSGAQHLPSSIGSNSGGIDWDGRNPDFQPLVNHTAVDFGFTELIDVPLAEGRSFSREFPTDQFNIETLTGAFMINKTLADMMEKEDVVGTQMEFGGLSGPVIGVIEDFHFLSMRTELPPLAIGVTAPEDYGFMLLRVNKQLPVDQLRQSLETTWNTVMPEYPFESHLLTDQYDRMYQAEQRTSKLMLYFTLVALVISSLGLFGLASFLAEKRRREIGIRKTLGSNNLQVIRLMIRQFTSLVLIAVVIAIPASYFFLKNWLKDYAYRIDLNFWFFVIPAVLIIILAVITVLWQAWRASKTNPAVCLQYE